MILLLPIKVAFFSDPFRSESSSSGRAISSGAQFFVDE
jgi:hypothetical protein